MKKLIKNSWPVVVLVITSLLYILPLVGYGMCFYKFVKCDFSNETSYKPEIVYGIGVFTGLGCVIGYMDLGE